MVLIINWKGLGYRMHCPKCGTKLTCGCDNCKAERKERDEPEPEIYMIVDDDILGCNSCGFVESGEWWESIENDIIDQEIIGAEEMFYTIRGEDSPEYRRMMNWMWN